MSRREREKYLKADIQKAHQARRYIIYSNSVYKVNDEIDAAIASMRQAHPELTPVATTIISPVRPKLPTPIEVTPNVTLSVSVTTVDTDIITSDMQPVTEDLVALEVSGFNNDTLNYKYTRQTNPLLETLADITRQGWDLESGYIDDLMASKSFSDDEMLEAIREGFNRWGREARVRLRNYFRGREVDLII